MKYIASTIVRASDIGLNDNLFGGTLLRWLDEYGALFTYKYLNHKFVTYKMQKTYFLKSAKQGDCIDFYVTNLKFNNVSVNFDLVAKINSCKPTKQIINTNMTFVAIDVGKQKPQRLNPMLFETDEFEQMIKQTSYKHINKDEMIFHNINHVQQMLKQLNIFKASMKSNEYKILFLAVCYHDVVHLSGNKDNEIESSLCFRKDWEKVFDKDVLNDVSELILSTKSNNSYQDIKEIRNADLLHDLDMISFIDYETMKNNDVKIRTQYSTLSPLQFYQYKLEYYKKLIKQGVFWSSFYKKYNNIAIQNIKKYSEQIKKLIDQMKKV